MALGEEARVALDVRVVDVPYAALEPGAHARTRYTHYDGEAAVYNAPIPRRWDIVCYSIPASAQGLAAALSKACGGQGMGGTGLGRERSDGETMGSPSHVSARYTQSKRILFKCERLIT